MEEKMFSVRNLVIGLGILLLLVLAFVVGSMWPTPDSPNCRTYQLVRAWGGLQAGQTYTYGCTFISWGGPPPGWAYDRSVQPPALPARTSTPAPSRTPTNVPSAGVVTTSNWAEIMMPIVIIALIMIVLSKLGLG